MSRAMYFLRVAAYPVAFIILGVRANTGKDLMIVLPMAIAIAIVALATALLAILAAVILTVKVTALTSTVGKVNLHGTDLIDPESFASDAIAALNAAVPVSMLVLSVASSAPVVAAFWCAAAVTTKVAVAAFYNNAGA